MRRHLFLTLVLFSLISCEKEKPTAPDPPPPPAPEKVLTAEPENAGSVTDLIHFPDTDEFLPGDWTLDPISAQTEPVDEKARETARTIVARALEKYPRTVLDQFLEGVYLVGSLRFYDVSYGGTYMANARRVILVYRPSFNDRGFEQRFHHEFSSLLLKKNEVLFEEERWRMGNPDTFVYRAPGVIEEQSGEKSEATRVLEAEQKKTGGSGSSLLAVSVDLMKQGFLTPYNQVSLEQDLNETAAHLFTNPELWKYCETHPRIDHKVDVLIDFYRKLDSGFDRIYFRTLTQAQPQPISP